MDENESYVDGDGVDGSRRRGKMGWGKFGEEMMKYDDEEVNEKG